MPALDQINQGGTIYEIVPEIAELFKTTKAYHTGDHVIYEAGWYTFKADKSAGAWDTTKVDGPFKVTDQISSIKEDLNATVGEINSSIEDITGVQILTDQYVNGYVSCNQSTIDITNTHPTSKSYKCVVLPCSEGDVFWVKGKSVSAIYALYAWVDANGSKISSRYAVTATEYEKAVAPANAVYLVCNTSIDADYGLIKGDIAIAEVNNVKDALTTFNLCVDSDTEAGYLSNTGVITSSATGDKTTDYIAVSEGDVINVQSWNDPGTGKLWIAVCTYDSAKTFISRAHIKEGSTGVTYLQTSYTIPSGVSYIRVSARFYGNLMITKGSFNIAFMPSAKDIATLTDISAIGVSGLRDDVGNVTGNTIYAGFVSGYIAVNTSTIDRTDIKSNLGYECLVVECSPSDVFYVKGHSGASTIYGLWTFIDDSGSKLSAGGVASYDDYQPIKAPTNSAYLIINADVSYAHGLIKNVPVGVRVTQLETSAKGASGMLHPLLRPATPKFVLHRGVSASAPENTIPAFELAGQGGAWGIETDIYETTDGYFVISHDNDVSRMTDGTGKITEMTYAQTQEFTIDAGNNIEQYPNLKMPLLEEYLSICRRYGCVACIEIKGITHYDELIAVVKKAGMEGSAVFLLYYDLTAISTIRGLTSMPILILGSLYSDLDSLIEKATEYTDLWLDIYSTTASAEVFANAHEVNVPIGIWMTDSESSANTFFRNGCDFVTTNSITHFTS